MNCRYRILFYQRLQCTCILPTRPHKRKKNNYSYSHYSKDDYLFLFHIHYQLRIFSNIECSAAVFRKYIVNLCRICENLINFGKSICSRIKVCLIVIYIKYGWQLTKNMFLMRVIHRVPDKFTTRSRQAHDTFTTKNRSRWISFNFVRDTFTTCSRLVRASRSRQISTHDSFATRLKTCWSCRERVVK
jgi:hypothetical protein